MQKDHINQLRQVSRKLIRELGMLQLNSSLTGQTPQNWHALIEIDKSPGITISQLAQLLLISVPSMSRIVNKLVDLGFVTTSSATDKREKSLQITAAGQTEIKHIDEFSNIKIKGAFDFLSESEQHEIISAIGKYSSALEKSRKKREGVKILKLTTSRTLRRQIVQMIENIQKHEFNIPVSPELNIGIMRAEEEYYFNNTYNFWYAVNDEGTIIGSVGLMKIDDKNVELKKLFVAQDYRGLGIAQNLVAQALKASRKHGFTHIYLSTVERLKGAQRFYEKLGLHKVTKSHMPKGFTGAPVDTEFYMGEIDGMD